MPVFALGEEILFPPPRLAEPDGLLAVGGDLSRARLVLAYQMGIFPWYDEPPVLWWSPSPRFVITPASFRVGRTLRKSLRRTPFEVTINREFRRVIERCQSIVRPGEQGTWIGDDMRAAYCALHHVGIAHSVEVWREEALVGGLYGVALGKVFFGESMFSAVEGASKVAFHRLATELFRNGCRLIDCQMETEHLRRFGAIDMVREEFEQELLESGVWDEDCADSVMTKLTKEWK